MKLSKWCCFDLSIVDYCNNLTKLLLTSYSKNLVGCEDYCVDNTTVITS